MPLVRNDSAGDDDVEAGGETPLLGGARGTKEASGKKHMSTLDLIALSISMAGAQIIWTMELG